MRLKRGQLVMVGRSMAVIVQKCHLNHKGCYLVKKAGQTFEFITDPKPWKKTESDNLKTIKAASLDRHTERGSK